MTIITASLIERYFRARHGAIDMTDCTVGMGIAAITREENRSTFEGGPLPASSGASPAVPEAAAGDGLGGASAGGWIVFIMREGGQLETTLSHFADRDEAEWFFGRASAQWTDSYLCRVVRGPGPRAEKEADGDAPDLAEAERLCALAEGLADADTTPAPWLALARTTRALLAENASLRPVVEAADTWEKSTYGSPWPGPLPEVSPAQATIVLGERVRAYRAGGPR